MLNVNFNRHDFDNLDGFIMIQNGAKFEYWSKTQNQIRQRNQMTKLMKQNCAKVVYFNDSIHMHFIANNPNHALKIFGVPMILAFYVSVTKS